MDGPQQASWAQGIKPAMNLRGQKVDMILKPTTSVRAVLCFVARLRDLRQTDWPGKI